MTNEIIFQNASKFLLMLERILAHTLLLELTENDRDTLLKCIAFKEAIDNQSIDIHVAQRLSVPNGQQFKVWAEQKVYDILQHRIPLYRLFGTEIADENHYQYQVFFVDADSDQSRSEILTFTSPKTITEVLARFKHDYDVFYLHDSLLECIKAGAYHVRLFSYNGKIIRERSIIE